MPAPQPSSSSGGEAGRVRCLYCGANNFPTSPACWQCSRPLKAMPEAPPALSSAASSSAASAPALLPGSVQALPGRPVTAESPLAPKAAAAMGMLFPLIGLPAGIIFLMLDDPRKTHLGWLLIGWSLAGTVLSVVPLLLILGPLLALLHGLAPHPGAPGPSLPGLPTDGGGAGDGLRMLLADRTAHRF